MMLFIVAGLEYWRPLERKKNKRSNCAYHRFTLHVYRCLFYFSFMMVIIIIMRRAWSGFWMWPWFWMWAWSRFWMWWAWSAAVIAWLFMVRTWARITSITYTIMIAVALIGVIRAGTIVEIVAHTIMVSVELAELHFKGANVGSSATGTSITMTSFVEA